MSQDDKTREDFLRDLGNRPQDTWSGTDISRLFLIAIGTDNLRPAPSAALPQEPTRAMLDAWSDVMRGIARHRPSTIWPGLHYSDSESLMVDAYQAMLNAAPQVPHGVCRADDPNREADQRAGSLYSPPQAAAPTASAGARGVAPSVSDDSAGTRIPAVAAPTSSELARLREFQRKIEEAEARCCPEDVGFEEWIGVLKRQVGERDVQIGTLTAAINAMNQAPNSATREQQDDAACERAAEILREEVRRLEYPKAMVPQEAEKITRRQCAFNVAILFLDPSHDRTEGRGANG